MPDMKRIKTKCTTAWIPVNQISSLKKVSRKTKISVAELVRMGVDLILEKHGKRAKDRTASHKNYKTKFKSIKNLGIDVCEW